MIKFFLKKYWHIVIFLILAVVNLSYILFHYGLYAFTDSGYYYSTITQAKQIFLSKFGLFSNTDGFYFGFDNSARAFASMFIGLYQMTITYLFGSYIGQCVFYFVYFLSTFYFAIKLFRVLIINVSDTSIKLGALFLTFNPFALLLLTLSSTSYIYPATLILCYFLILYLRDGKYSHLLFSLLSVSYIITYLRLLPIIALTVVLLVPIFHKSVLFSVKRFVIFIFLILLFLLPFFVGNMLSIKNNTNIVSNYQNGFEKYDQANYSFKSSFLFSLSNPGGFTPSALSYVYNNRGEHGLLDNYNITDTIEPYKIIQILFNAGVLIIALFYLKNKKILYLITIITFIILLNTIGHFVSFNVFQFLNKTILVFLYNDYGFLQFAQSIFYSIFIIYSINEFKNIKLKKCCLILLIIYLFISALPTFSKFDGFKKVGNIPETFRTTFLDGSVNNDRINTIFVPYYWLKFDWAPYYLGLNILNDSKYNSVIVPNFRVVSASFINFFNNIYNEFSNANFSNLSLFNVKDLFLFKNVVDANNNLDAYGVRNIEERSVQNEEQLSTQSGLKQLNTNVEFNHYQFINSGNYDFFLYSPREFIKKDIEYFFDNKINIENAPVISDVGGNYIGNSVHVSYKQSLNNSEKYYVKVSGVGDLKSFPIQLNQSYSKSWNVFPITKSEYESVKCTDESNYTITNNDKCYYQSTSFNPSDIKFIAFKDMPSQHYVGNYFGNLFIIDTTGNTNDAYFVIYFGSQSYYDVSLIVSLMTIVGLVIVCVYQNIRKSK